MEISHDIARAAFDLYEPPFSFKHGYIFDANGKTFSDMEYSSSVPEEKYNYIARIRGWGAIQYLNEYSAYDLQDEVGNHMAKALTEYWEKNA